MKKSQAASSLKASADEIQLGRLANFIGFRLRRIQNQLAKRFAEATQEYELRSGLFTSLALIAANPGISQNDLSQAVGADKSVTVQIIDELERRGYARRERSAVDRRRHALVVTESGEAFLDELFAILMETEADALNQLNEGELLLLKNWLDRIYSHLKG